MAGRSSQRDLNCHWVLLLYNKIRFIWWLSRFKTLGQMKTFSRNVRRFLQAIVSVIHTAHNSSNCRSMRNSEFANSFANSRNCDRNLTTYHLSVNYPCVVSFAKSSMLVNSTRYLVNRCNYCDWKTRLQSLELKPRSSLFDLPLPRFYWNLPSCIL